MVDVYEAGEVDGRLYIAMRWVEGSDLRARDRRATGALDPGARPRSSRRSPTRSTPPTQRGLVHRDVKPANILLGSAAGASTPT